MSEKNSFSDEKMRMCRLGQGVVLHLERARELIECLAMELDADYCALEEDLLEGMMDDKWVE